MNDTKYDDYLCVIYEEQEFIFGIVVNHALIYDLMEKIEMKLKIPISCQRLIYDDEYHARIRLEDQYNFEEKDIKGQYTEDVNFPLRRNKYSKHIVLGYLRRFQVDIEIPSLIEHYILSLYAK